MFPSELQAIVGQWQWIRSCCGYFGDEMTPGSLQVSISVRFEEDGTVRVFDGGVEVRQTAVTVRRGWSYAPAADVTVLRYKPRLEEEQTAAFRGADSLDLVSDCFDCHGVWSFVRVRATALGSYALFAFVSWWLADRNPGQRPTGAAA